MRPAIVGVGVAAALLLIASAWPGSASAASGTRVVVDGFEAGGPRGWSVARGGDVQTAHHRTGERALKTSRGRGTTRLVRRLPRARAAAVAFHLRIAGPGKQTLVTFGRNRISLVTSGSRSLSVVVRGKRVRNVVLPFSPRRWHRLAVEARSKSNTVAVFLGGRRIARVSARIAPERRIEIGDLDRRVSGPVYLDNVVITTKARLNGRSRRGGGAGPTPATPPDPASAAPPERAAQTTGQRYKLTIEPNAYTNYGAYHDAFWLKHDRERINLGFEGSIEFVMKLPTDWPAVKGWGVVTNLHGAPGEPAWDTPNPSPIRIQLHETSTPASGWPNASVSPRRAISVATNGAGTFNGTLYANVQQSRRAVDLEPYLGRDVRVRLNFKLDSRPGQGYYELLLDGEVAIPRTNTATMYPTATHVLLWEGFYRPGNLHPSGAGNTQRLEYELTAAQVTDAARPTHTPVLERTWGSPPKDAGAPASRYE